MGVGDPQRQPPSQTNGEMKRIRISRRRPDPPGTRRVCRPSRWGNPYKVGPEMSRRQAVERYEIWLLDRLREEPDFLRPLYEAVALGCYCSPDQPCHADVLIRYIRQARTFGKER